MLACFSDMVVLFSVYQWSLAGSFMQQLNRPFTSWGLVALVCLDCMVLFSTSLWRQKAYALFLATHTIGAILVLPAVRVIAQVTKGVGLIPASS